MPQMLSELGLLTVKRRRPCFVVPGHRPQPARGLDMREVIRNLATALSVIEQSALFDGHLATTPQRLNGPSLVTDSSRNNTDGAGKIGNRQERDRPGDVEMTFAEGYAMNDASQLATAMLATAFAAMLLLTGQWFMDYRVQREATSPIVAMRFMRPVARWTAPSTESVWPVTKPNRPGIASGA